MRDRTVEQESARPTHGPSSAPDRFRRIDDALPRDEKLPDALQKHSRSTVYYRFIDEPGARHALKELALLP